MTVSVAMAVFNGEKYLKEQIDSILCQLSADDELVVSDNGSADRSVEILKDYAARDARIKLCFETEKSVILNFNNAVTNTQNDIIFLCDQDDVWRENKIQQIKAAFLTDSDRPMLIAHACTRTDSELNSLGKCHCARRGYLRNLIKNSYTGACMAFHKDLKNYILPFKKEWTMHDLVIALLCEKLKLKIKILTEDLMLYRRHCATVTGRAKNGIGKKIRLRSMTARCVRERIKEIKK